MNADAAYAELIRRAKQSAVLASCGSLLHWDQATYMPAHGAQFRGDQLALIAQLTHEMNTAPAIAEYLAVVDGAALDPAAVSNIREIRRVYERAVKLPSDLVAEIARVTSQAQLVWQDARKNDDFAAFEPLLAKVIDLKRQEAQAVGYTEHPYDALLDEYEPGATAAQVRQIFAALATELVPLIAKIGASPKRPASEILQRTFPIEAQKQFATLAATKIGFDFNAGRLDTTTHPFCSGIGPGDCRITTRYNERFFNESFFGVLHEAGHGMYDQGLPGEHFGTALGTYCSLGIHESQSRLWENQVGRSRPFWEYFYPQAQAAFPAALGSVPLDDFYFAINEAKPSLIRVEADEATYNLHIILRFELELELLTGNLAARDLPGAWNDRFTAMFGITPPTNRLGCLQDIHWSMGGLGYFPTYTLGNLYAAQLMAHAKAQFPGLDDDFRAGHFERLKTWLNQEVHARARTMRSEELCRAVTEQGLAPTALMQYLHEKYGALYG